MKPARFRMMGAAIVGIFFALLFHPAMAAEKLTGSKIKELMPGGHNLVVYGFDISVTATAGGNLKVTFLGDEISGKWSVKGDQLCVTLIVDDKSESECADVQHEGGKNYVAGGLKFVAK